MRHKILIFGGAFAIIVVSLAILAQSLKVPIEFVPAPQTEKGQHQAEIESINAAAEQATAPAMTQEQSVNAILAAQARAQAHTQ